MKLAANAALSGSESDRSFVFNLGACQRVMGFSQRAEATAAHIYRRGSVTSILESDSQVI